MAKKKDKETEGIINEKDQLNDAEKKKEEKKDASKPKKSKKKTKEEETEELKIQLAE